MIQVKGEVKIKKKSNIKVGNPVRFTKSTIAFHDKGFPAFNEEEINSTKVVKEIPNESTRVADLTSSKKDFRIRATVCRKHPMKFHAKGQLFKVDLVCDIDKQTMIEGTFYTEESQHFDNLVTQGQTYNISGLEVSSANKKFTSIPHDYRLIFKMTTSLELVEKVVESEEKVAERVNLTNINELLEQTTNLFHVEIYGQVTCDVE